MLVAIAVVCVQLAIYANRFQREQHAIQILTGLGIEVTVGSSAPVWLPEALDGAWFQRVLAINSAHANRGTAAVEYWGRFDESAAFSNIELFFLIERNQNPSRRQPAAKIVTDDLLRVIGGLDDCKVLRLGNSQISNAGLKHLRTLRRLQYLDVSETGLTENAVVRLATLCNLAGLNIRGTQISDNGFRRLQLALPECQICR